MFVGATGPTGVITSPRFFTDGANGYGAGISLFARVVNPTIFATPAEPANDAGAVDAFTFTSTVTKPLDVINPGPYSGTNHDFGDYLVLYMAIDSTVTAPQNPTSSEVLSIQWDET